MSFSTSGNKGKSSLTDSTLQLLSCKAFTALPTLIPCLLELLHQRCLTTSQSSHLRSLLCAPAGWGSEELSCSTQGQLDSKHSTLSVQSTEARTTACSQRLTTVGDLIHGIFCTRCSQPVSNATLLHGSNKLHWPRTARACELRPAARSSLASTKLPE